MDQAFPMGLELIETGFVGDPCSRMDVPMPVMACVPCQAFLEDGKEDDHQRQVRQGTGLDMKDAGFVEAVRTVAVGTHKACSTLGLGHNMACHTSAGVEVVSEHYSKHCAYLSPGASHRRPVQPPTTGYYSAGWKCGPHVEDCLRL